MTQAARRLEFTGDRRLENEPPDDTGIPDTVLVAAGEEHISPAEYRDLLRKNETAVYNVASMRR